MSSETILLVEDEAELLDLVKELLEMESYKVIGASTGKVALEVMKNQRPPIVLCDESLPDMSGHEVLARVGECYSTRPLFFFCTGSVEISEKEAKKEGATGVFHKPYNVDDLVAVLKKLTS